MSHQLQGTRAGLINREFDQRFLDRLVHDPEALAQMSPLQYLREAGSEGNRTRHVADHARGTRCPVDEVYRFYHVPASNTALGHMILQNRA